MASDKQAHIEKIMEKGATTRARTTGGGAAGGRVAVVPRSSTGRGANVDVAVKGTERVTRVTRGATSAARGSVSASSRSPKLSSAAVGEVSSMTGSGAAAGSGAKSMSGGGGVGGAGGKASVTQKKGVNSTNYPDRNIWVSLILLFVAGFLGICCVSYLIHWSMDQSAVGFGRAFAGSGETASNWGGSIGATISNYVMGEWFGVCGLLLPLAVFIASIQVLRIPSLRLRMGVTSTLMLMIVGSVAMGHFFGMDPHALGSGLGGGIGIMAAQWMDEVLGYWGTTLLVILAFVGYAYFATWAKVVHLWDKYKVWRDARRDERATRRELVVAVRGERMAKIAASRSEALLRAAEAAAKHREITQSATSTSTSTSSISAVPVFASDTTTTTSAISEPSSSSSLESENVVSRTIEARDVRDVREAQLDSNTASISADNGFYMPLDQEVELQSVRESYAPHPPFVVEIENGQAGYFVGYDELGYAIIYRWLGYDAYGFSGMDRGYLSANTSQNSDFYNNSVSNAIQGRVADDSDVEFFVRTVQPASVVPQSQSSLQSSPGYMPEFSTPSTVSSPSGSTVYPAPEIVKPAMQVVDSNFVVEQAPQELQVDDRTINMVELYDPTLELGRYIKPPIELMTNHTRKVTVTDEELLENKNRIVHTLENFGIKIDTIEATIGPTVTLYEIIPAPGVRISKIKNLEDDIALALSALGIRIIAPIPGRGTIGIEVPNKDKEVVSMYSVIKSARFQESKAELPIALGKTIENETFVMDLAKMPHLLVAGATGQGKSVGLNAIITSLLYKKHPSELKFILVDPKKVELTLYARLEKHFLAKLPDAEEAIITDTQKVIYTLNSICIEMDGRYDLLKMAKVRNIKEYNEKFINRVLNPNKGHRFLPYFVVIVDEFADLIMTAGREVETPIARIAQLARAVGIHLIIATQRPTTNIITGVIKANFPARIAFRVTSMIDSRTILDSPGANQLVGKGDMLVSTGSEVTRVQCAFIDTPEVELIAEHIGSQQGYPTAYLLPEYVPENEGSSSSSSDDMGKRDSLFEEVARYVVANDNGSASTIQRKFSIGFNRAGRIVDQLEAAGIVGRSEGSKPRQVLINDPMSLEMILDNMN